MTDATIKFIDKQIIKINCKLLQLEENKEYAEGNKFEKTLNEIRNLNQLIDNLSWFKELYNAKQSGKYEIVLKPQSNR